MFHAANLGVALLAAVVILIPGAPLLSIALNANVLATVLLPVSLVFMLMLANDRPLMTRWANRPSTNAIGNRRGRVRELCGAAYGFDSFLQSIHVSRMTPSRGQAAAAVSPRCAPGEAADEQELIMHLEPDQLVAETLRPVPRADLSARTLRWLWALRIFVVIATAMVIYTFIEQLS